MTINHVLIIKPLIISYINASLLLNYQYLCQCQYFSIQLGQVTFELASLDLVLGPGLVLLLDLGQG